MEQSVKQLTKKFDASMILASNPPPRLREPSLPPSIDTQTSSDGENANSTAASDREANTMVAPMREMLKELENKLDEVSGSESGVCANSILYLLKGFLTLYHLRERSD